MVKNGSNAFYSLAEEVDGEPLHASYGYTGAEDEANK